ncbi:MAG: VOC family protein [Hyphomicrobiaceae bacterium]
MKPGLTVITLGVSTMATSRAFYEKLGYVASSHSNDNVTFFDAGGVVLALFGRAALADDAHVPNSAAGFAGVTVARNMADEAAVDRVMAEAVAAGARVMKVAAKTFWGGYGGYFSDPDGHLWEVAHNPFWPLDADGRVQLPV